MTYVDHRIDQRMSRFWPVSQEQQDLSAVEIVEAAEGIRQHVWRDGTPSDPKLQERKSAAVRELCRLHPVTICVVHDNEHETDKADMLTKMEEAFAKVAEARGCSTGPPVAIHLGFLNIWVVLVIQGENKFIGPCSTFDYDEKPSEYLQQHDLQHLGVVRSPLGAVRSLRDDGFFRKDSD
jgi:hypothetical protein